MGIINLLRRGLKVAAFVYGVTFAGVLGFTATVKNPVDLPQADLIVCLGGGAHPDGTLAPSSAGRAVACADLFAKGAAPKVLFSGANTNQTVQSTALGMARLAMEHGLPEDAILLEEKSRSTLQNALFSAPQIKDDDTIILVTQGFHLMRSEASFWVMGPWKSDLWMSEAYPRHTDGTIKWWSLHREALAVWFNLGRYAVWKVGKTAGLKDIDHWLT